MSRKVVVDFELCEANAVCMAAAPKVFEVDDEDILHVLMEKLPDELVESAKNAERMCPRQAIKIVED